MNLSNAVQFAFTVCATCTILAAVSCSNETAPPAANIATIAGATATLSKANAQQESEALEALANVRKALAAATPVSPIDSERKTNNSTPTPAWESSPFYARPPVDRCITVVPYIEPNSALAGVNCYLTDVGVTLTSTTTSYADAGDTVFDGPAWTCGTATWGFAKAYTSTDGTITYSESPTTSGGVSGPSPCTRQDTVTTSVSRVSSPRSTLAAQVYTVANLPRCLIAPVECATGQEPNAWLSVYAEIAPPQCPAFASQGYAAASAANIDPDLIMAFAANETGYPDADSGQDVYQTFATTNPAVYNSAGRCIDLCGEGPWQIDIGANPNYTGALNLTPNAGAAAAIISTAIAVATSFLGSGASTSQIYDAAANYYNGGFPGLHNPSRTTHQSWLPNESLTYGDSLMRHYQRILDFRSHTSCKFN